MLAVKNGINAQITSGGSGGITIVANGTIDTPRNADIFSNINGGTGNTAITYNSVLVSRVMVASTRRRAAPAA